MRIALLVLAACGAATPRVRAPADCTVEDFAIDQQGPLTIANDDTHVYWNDTRRDLLDESLLRRRAKHGGPVETISVGEYPASFAFDDHYVYWAVLMRTGWFKRWPRTGGDAEYVRHAPRAQNNKSIRWTRDATHTYYVFDTAVHRIPRGCAIPDSDGDGYTDEVDECPSQPESANPIDRDGCVDATRS